MRRSSEISALKIREKKSWRVIDQYLAESDRKKVNAKTKLEAAVFVLSRLYPQKLEQEINVKGEIGIFFENNAEELDSAQEAILSRFAARAGASSN